MTSDGSELDCDTFPYQVNLFLPKFGIETSAHLEKLLAAMGMHDAMSATEADFGGITAADRLFIGSVVHQANIDVDESGTTASAATVVGADTTGGCGSAFGRTTVTMRFNRPFVFVLRDLQTNAVLFMGRVTDPTAR
jgi:serpin B